ncbi:MAG: DciA family protein [Candidatus Nanopelagicales bacterium]
MSPDPDDLDDLAHDGSALEEEAGDPEPTVDAAKEALARARAAAAASPRVTSTPDRRRTAPAAPAASGSGPDARDPRLLGPSVDALLRERGWTQSAAVGGLTGRWADIVGADVAEHVVPETFEQAPDGRGLLLVLRADSTAWATTLQYMLPALRTRIDEELGAGTVADISVLGPAAPSWRHGRLSAPGRGPRDTYG